MTKKKRKKRIDSDERVVVLSTRVKKKEAARIRGFSKLQKQTVSEYLRERGLDRAARMPK